MWSMVGEVRGVRWSIFSGRMKDRRVRWSVVQGVSMDQQGQGCSWSRKAWPIRCHRSGGRWFMVWRRHGLGEPGGP